MTKEELKSAVQTARAETAAALQTIYDALNQGQQKKLQKQPVVAELLQRYEVKL